VKLASREPNNFIATNCFMAPENAKIFHVTSRNDCISMKQFLQYASKLQEKIKNKV
jgi:hypothetical protein